MLSFSKNVWRSNILKFDDTNPSKEKGEFEEKIKKDSEALQIKTDTYSSNYFAQLREYIC